MSSSAQIAQLLALIFAIGVGVLVLWVGARRAMQRFLMRRVEARVERAQHVLADHRKVSFKATERLLFQLGELADVAAVENALNTELEQADAEARPGLVKVYRALGIVERYRKQLLESVKWTKRAAAAHALGRLNAVEAIPDLVEALRDPHEDARSVKLAAAQALGRMGSSEAVPLLLDELERVDEWASPRIAEVLVAVGREAVPPLIEALADEERKNARVWAAQILGRLAAPGSVQAMLPHLRDRSEQVRMSVAEALGRMGDRRAVSDLVRVAMRDPVPSVRAEAARALGQIGDPDVVQSLVGLLGDPDYWTRLRAIEAIEAVAPKDLAPLEAALADLSSEVRRRAAVALERLGALNQCVQALRGNEQDAVAHARATLVRMGRAGLLDSIMSYLDHDDFRVRARVAQSLGEVGDARAVEALSSALGDELWPVRVRAAEAIGRLQPDDGVRILLPALSDDEEAVREAGVEAIRAMGPPERREELNRIIGLFESGNALVRCTVIEAVGRVGDPRIDKLLRKAMVDPSSDVRLHAFRCAAEHEERHWSEALINALNDSDMRVRAAAATGLGRIGTTDALEAITQHLDTPDRQFREALTSALAGHGVGAVLESEGAEPPSPERTLTLVWALGKTGSADAVPRLRRLGEAPSFQVRAAVCGALGKLTRYPSVRPILEQLLHDRNERVRAAAVNALARSEDPEVVAALLRVRDDPDSFVRGRLALALGMLGGERALEGLSMLWERASGAREQACVVIGYALTGREEGLEASLAQFDHESMKAEVERVLAREPEETRERFRDNLHLGLGGSVAASVLSTSELTEHYIQVLRNHQRPEARAAAVAALQAIGVAPHRDLLIDTVRTDPDPDVRRLALGALVHEGPDETFKDLLVKALRDPSSGVQVEAVSAIGLLANPDYNAVVIGCFRLGHHDLDAAAVKALVAANGRRVTEFLDELMGYGEPAILHGGARVLGEIGDPAATGILRAWLGSPHADLRRTSVSALGRIGTVESQDAVVESLADPAESVRLAAVEALGLLHGADVVEAVAALTSDPSVPVRVALARLVGRSRNLAAIDIAATLCGDPQPRVRQEALVSLLLIGSGSALERFSEQMASQPDHIKQALGELQPSHEAIERTLATFRSDRRALARVTALRALTALGHRPIDLLIEALRDPAPEVRTVGVEAAVGLESETLEEALEALLDDPDPAVRDAVRKSKLTLIG